MREKVFNIQKAETGAIAPGCGVGIGAVCAGDS